MKVFQLIDSILYTVTYYISDIYYITVHYITKPKSCLFLKERDPLDLLLDVQRTVKLVCKKTKDTLADAISVVDVSIVYNLIDNLC